MRLLAGALLAGMAVTAGAAEAPDLEQVRQSLDRVMPGVKPDTVTPAPVAGLYEVTVGPKLFYVSADGRYLVDGTVIDTQERANVTRPREEEVRAGAMAEIPEDKMIVFSPEGTPRHAVTVFTDIDCGYCRKLHNNIDTYLERGIEVRYLLYPRTGVDTPSYHKAVAVWCAEDRNAALTAAKAGNDPGREECDNPVQEHMHLGELVGVRGTPTIVLDNGRIVPGYYPAERLQALFNQGG